ncbi:unnamed protein product, partial [Heterosigma akashiwo]
PAQLARRAREPRQQVLDPPLPTARARPPLRRRRRAPCQVAAIARGEQRHVGVGGRLVKGEPGPVADDVVQRVHGQQRHAHAPQVGHRAAVAVVVAQRGVPVVPADERLVELAHRARGQHVARAHPRGAPRRGAPPRGGVEPGEPPGVDLLQALDHPPREEVGQRAAHVHQVPRVAHGDGKVHRRGGAPLAQVLHAHVGAQGEAQQRQGQPGAALRPHQVQDVGQVGGPGRAVDAVGHDGRVAAAALVLHQHAPARGGQRGGGAAHVPLGGGGGEPRHEHRHAHGGRARGRLGGVQAQHAPVRQPHQARRVSHGGLGGVLGAGDPPGLQQPRGQPPGAPEERRARVAAAAWGVGSGGIGAGVGGPAAAAPQPGPALAQELDELGLPSPCLDELRLGDLRTRNTADDLIVELRSVG